MNEITIFENPEFGSVRTITIDGEPWLVGRKTLPEKWKTVIRHPIRKCD